MLKTRDLKPPRCAYKLGGSSLAPYDEEILDTPSSLVCFQALDHRPRPSE